MFKLRSLLLLSLLALPLATVCFITPRAQAQSSNAKKSKTAKTESCDGALDIVPAKTMTFTRKRRPGKASDAPASQQPAKSSEGAQ